jgi:hypothetical protein
MSGRIKNALKIYFCDNNGKLVLFETPNWVLIGFLFWLVVYLFSNNTVQNVSFILSSIFLLWWAILEIFNGVTYFRRTLGLIAFLAAGVFIFIKLN